MSNTELDLDQLETWEQALNEGRKLAQQATEQQAAAAAAEQAHQWQTAADLYRQTRTTYASALTQLEAPAAITDTSYKALKSLRDEAQQIRQSVQAALTTLDQDQRAARCEQNIKEALDLLEQANTARIEGNYDEARTLAIQARDKDAALSDDADRIIRAADEEAGEGSSRQGIIATIVILLLVVGTGVFFGPTLWNWFSAMLFPVGASIQGIYQL
jgi:hypothetical protein